MSTTTSNPSPIRAAAGPGPAFHRVLNSEFIKFRTLRSTLILLACTAAVMLPLAALRADSMGTIVGEYGDSPGFNVAEYIAGVPTSGVVVAVLILGSLGVMLMSSEFTTGMARSTFAAVPKRIPAFWAKLVVVMAAGFLLTAVTAWFAGLISIPILEDNKFALDLGSPTSVRFLLVNSIYVASVGAIGASIGAILRNSAGGIMSLFGLVFLAPSLLGLFPGDLAEAAKYLPSKTIAPLTALNHDPDMLEAWQAALVLGAWVVVPVVVAMLLLKKRDV
ncbi:hypothetical protein GCM10023063_01750 [Arthrobacter methylotrophus]|uniref:ABC transporter permease n=1 Tax=Arthrobacter methylotrophus TaxID=121291 RepID=A0ABV5UND1_9MICC